MADFGRMQKPAGGAQARRHGAYGPSSASSTSGGAACALRQRPVVAAEEHERLAVLRHRSTTSPTPIRWSPPGSRSRSSQASPRGSPSSAGTPSRSDQSTPSNFSRLGHLRGEPRRDLLLVVGEELDAEPARMLARPRACAPSREADDHQRRVQRERGDRVGGHARRAVGPSEVTTQTPVAKRPQASRTAGSRSWSIPGLAMPANLEGPQGEKPSGTDPFAAVLCGRRPG